VLTVALALVSTTAVAGEEEARELFQQAKEAYSNKEYERAAELLKRAYDEEANLTYQYNRIRALQGAGEYEKALEVLKTYETPMLDADGFEDIPEIKASLREKLDRTDEPTDQKQNRTLRTVGWALGGTGVASLTVSALFGSMLLLPSDVRENARDDEVRPENTDLVESHKTATAISLGVGLASLIGGGVILFNEFSGGPEKRAGTDSQDPRVRWSPFATPESAGARVEIRY